MLRLSPVQQQLGGGCGLWADRTVFQIELCSASSASRIHSRWMKNGWHHTNGERENKKKKVRITTKNGHRISKRRQWKSVKRLMESADLEKPLAASPFLDPILISPADTASKVYTPLLMWLTLTPCLCPYSHPVPSFWAEIEDEKANRENEFCWHSLS